jgi:selenocysteine-specific elongation factor
MKYVIVGTAGHVDHGKTALIQYLTGVDTDRLTEEKRRGISIELGFAPFYLPSGRLAGVIDVPGHERFIRQMLAGVGGLDLVLLVIAANEGVMPQTLEHLHILDLLDIENGILVITKKDLVDEEWLEMVQEDVRKAVRNTFLEAAPLVSVSVVTGDGIEHLKQVIDDMTQEIQGKNINTGFRLPVDRVFTMKGSGTVVTGTLISGSLRMGDVAEILPLQREVRVRQIQVHGKKVDLAEAGQRVAANLAGVEVGDLERGFVIAQPGMLFPTTALDCRLTLLDVSFTKEIQRPLTNRTRIRFHTGTQEVLGRILLLEADEMAPGETSYVQIFLEESAVVARGDRFILRTYSPVHTIGGGTVVEPYARKHKRFENSVIEALMVKEQGTPQDRLDHFFLQHPEQFYFQDELSKETGMSDDEVIDAVQAMHSSDAVKFFRVDGRVMVVHASMDLLQKFHMHNPLRSGIPQEELRTKLYKTLSPKTFTVILKYLQEKTVVMAENKKVRLPDFRIKLSAEETHAKSIIMDAFQKHPFSPPSLKELSASTSLSFSLLERVVEVLVDSGGMTRVNEELIFLAESVEEAGRFVGDHFKKQQDLTLAEFRDMLGTSRKYALGLLELFDAMKLTRRVGDKRLAGRALVDIGE